MFYNDPRKIVDLIVLTMNAQIAQNAQNGKTHKNGPNSYVDNLSIPISVWSW